MIMIRMRERENLNILGGLGVILEDDGDVHVDDDQEVDDQIGEDVCDAHGGVTAVARVTRLRVRFQAVLLVDDTFQDGVPAGRRRQLEEEDHRLAERFKVVHLVDARHVLDVHEERHAEYGVDEHDQEEQQADVEQRRHGHGQREQERPYALGAFDQSQDAPHFGHAHHSQQRRRHKVFLDQVAQHQTYTHPNPILLIFLLFGLVCFGFISYLIHFSFLIITISLWLLCRHQSDITTR